MKMHKAHIYKKEMAYTKEDKKNFLAMLKGNGGNIADVCKTKGVGRRTVYEWIDKEEWFKDGIDDIREISVDNVETALYKNAIEGNITAQIFFLKTRGKERGYIEKQEFAHTIEKSPFTQINLDVEEDHSTG